MAAKECLAVAEFNQALFNHNDQSTKTALFDVRILDGIFIYST